MTDSDAEEVLVSGDTKGNLFVFEYSQNEEEAKGSAVEEVHAYQQLKAHNNERVFCIRYNEGQLYSTSKDKHVNVYRFNRTEDGVNQEGTFLLPSSQLSKKVRYYLSKVS